MRIRQQLLWRSWDIIFLFNIRSVHVSLPGVLNNKAQLSEAFVSPVADVLAQIRSEPAEKRLLKGQTGSGESPWVLLGSSAPIHSDLLNFGDTLVWCCQKNLRSLLKGWNCHKQDSESLLLISCVIGPSHPSLPWHSSVFLWSCTFKYNVIPACWG